MKKLGFVVAFLLVSLSFVFSATNSTLSGDLTLTAAMGPMLNMSFLTSTLDFGSLEALTADVERTGKATIRSNVPWKFTISADNSYLTLFDNGAYVASPINASQQIPYTLKLENASGTEITVIENGTITNTSLTNYSKTTSGDDFTFTVIVNDVDVTAQKEVGNYQDIITFEITAQ